MSQEFKPCPFCGEKQQNVISNGFKNHFVECENCGASGPAGDTEASAIAEWNRRAHDEVIEKCRVALEEARGDVENALNLLNAMKGYPRFDRRIAEQKQQLARHDEAIAAIKELKR